MVDPFSRGMAVINSTELFKRKWFGILSPSQSLCSNWNKDLPSIYKISSRWDTGFFLMSITKGKINCGNSFIQQIHIKHLLCVGYCARERAWVSSWTCVPPNLILRQKDWNASDPWKYWQESKEGKQRNERIQFGIDYLGWQPARNPTGTPGKQHRTSIGFVP